MALIHTRKANAEAPALNDDELANIIKELRHAHQNGGPTPEMEQAFAAFFIPLAKQTAKSRASRYKGSKHAAQLDQQAFFSAAIQALTEIVKEKSVWVECVPELLPHLCATAMNREMIDLERRIGGRKKYKPGLLSIDAEKGYKTDESYKENLQEPYDPLMDLQTKDAIEVLKKRLQHIFAEKSYAVICAAIDYKPQGYTDAEIGGMLNMNPITYHTTLCHVRKRLREDYPEIEESMKSLIRESVPTMRKF